MDKVLGYAKGITAGLGSVAVLLLDYGNHFCGSVWPVITGVLTTALVVLVPNKK